METWRACYSPTTLPRFVLGASPAWSGEHPIAVLRPSLKALQGCEIYGLAARNITTTPADVSRHNANQVSLRNRSPPHLPAGLPFHVFPVYREERRRGYSPFLVTFRRGEPSGEVMRRRGHTSVRERPVHPVDVSDGRLCRVVVSVAVRV